MENSQPLATDSFSYSWLIDPKPSIDGLVESFRPSLDGSFGASIKEVMYVVNHGSKFLKEDQDFDFNVCPGSRSPGTLVPADEIFSDGCIKPVYATRSKMQFQTSTSTPAPPLSSFPPITVCSAYNRSQYYYFLRKWSKSSNKILRKCFAFFRPFCQRLGCSRKSIRVVDLDRKFWEVRSWSNSLQASPDRRTAYSADNWADHVKLRINKDDVYKRLRNVKSWNSSPQASPQRSPSHPTYARCDIESSIHEAILHCKRSFAQ